MLDRPLSRGRTEVRTDNSSISMEAAFVLPRDRTARSMGRGVCGSSVAMRLSLSPLAWVGEPQVSLSAFAFLFSELVQYCQQRVSRVTELENRLEEVGFRVGERVLELCCYREKVPRCAKTPIVPFAPSRPQDALMRRSLCVTVVMFV